MNDLRSRFGRRLRELRKAKGWTQEQLALRSGLSREYLSRIETGNRNVSLDVVQALSEALEIEAYLLFTKETDPDS